MFISSTEKEAIKRELSNLWDNVSTLEKARQLLFKKDFHNTERPKVDILSDTVADNETNRWTALGELQKRVDKLENKK